MNSYIEIVRVVGGETASVTYPLRKDRISVGRGLRNDLLLLHSDVREVEGEIQLQQGRATWSPGSAESGSQPIDCRASAVVVGPYRLRVRIERFPRKWLLPLLILPICLGLFLYPKRNAIRSLVASSVVTSIPLPVRGSFGPVHSDRPWNGREIFTFEHSGKESLILHYTPGNLDIADWIAIRLNGKRIGFVPSCSGHWSAEQRLRLRSQSIRKGLNQIEFVQGKRSTAGPTWGVRDVYVMPSENLAEDGEDYQAMYGAARRLFKEWTSKPGQLDRARRLLDRAISGWKATTGEVPPKALSMQREIEKAQQQLLSNRLSDAKGAASMGDPDRAQAIFDGLLEEFIDSQDPRRQQIYAARRKIK